MFKKILKFKNEEIVFTKYFFFQFQNLIALCLVFASLTSAHPVPEAESEAKSYYVSCSRKIKSTDKLPYFFLSKKAEKVNDQLLKEKLCKTLF